MPRSARDVIEKKKREKNVDHCQPMISSLSSIPITLLEFNSLLPQNQINKLYLTRVEYINHMFIQYLNINIGDVINFWEYILNTCL